MKILSFGHLLSKEAVNSLTEKLSKNNQENINYVPVRFNLKMNDSFPKQIEELIFKHIKDEHACPVIVLPGVSVASCIITVYLHGYYGYFPLVAELTKKGPHSYWVLKEIHNLGDIREMGRKKRFSK